MTILLNNVYSYLEKGEVSAEQALYLIYTSREISYPIKAQELLELTKLKLIVNGKVSKEVYSEESVKTGLKGTIKPLYLTDISKQISTRLCNYVCVKNPITEGLLFPSGETTAHHTAENFLNGEGLIAYHYLIFMFLFPIEGETNKRWEKHFFNSTPYHGARLRQRSKSSANEFKKIARKKDMGVFLYGTYLFIKSGVKENKSYIKSVSNYLKEYDEWYKEAEIKIKKAKNLEELFNVNASTEGRLNVAL